MTSYGNIEVIKCNNGKCTCKCVCGNIIQAREVDIKNGLVHSCGCKSTDNMIGKHFGKLVVDKLDRVKGGARRWLCRCVCGSQTIISIEEKELLRGNKLTCGKCKDSNLNGRQFSNLKVIGYSGKNNWWCKCNCGNKEYISIPDWALTQGYIKSCGCAGEKIKRYNNNNLYEWVGSGDIVLYASNTGTKYIIDEIMFEKVKDFRWREHQNKLIAYKNMRYYDINSIILGKELKDKRVIFIDGDNKNLRKSNMSNTIKKNSISNRVDNKTGHRGVSLYGKNKYRAQIYVNGKNIVLGVRTKFEDAVELREQAEKKYL